MKENISWLVDTRKVYVLEGEIGDRAQGSKKLDSHISFFLFSFVILKTQTGFFFILKLVG